MDVKVARSSRTEQVIGKTCVYWLAGKCNRNPCRFLHSAAPATASCNAANAGYHNAAWKRHYPSHGEIASYPSSCRADTGYYNAAKKHHSSYVYEKPLTKHNTKAASYVYEKPLPKPNAKTVLNRKIGDNKGTAQVVEASFSKHNTKTVLNRKTGDNKASTEVAEASLPKHNTEPVLNRKIGDDRDGTEVDEVSQKPSPSICKYWVNDSCVHGDQCQNLHSWFYGDGFSSIAKLEGHKKLITGMTIPDGSDKLYSGSTDGTLRTWDCRTGQCVDVTNLGAEITSLISEGPWIFVGMKDTVKAWHISTAAPFTLDGPKGQVHAMIVAKDTHTLLAGAEDGVISAWRGSSEANSPFKLVASLCGHTKSVVCLAVGGSKMLYSGSRDQTIKVWDLDTFECTMTLNAHTDAVTSLICWDKFLLSGSSDCTIKVWFQNKAGTLEVAYSHNVENGVVTLSGMTDPENKPIIFCSAGDNSVHLYELPSFAERGRLFAKQEVGLVDIAPGGLFFTGDRTGLLTVWKWLEEYKVVASS